MNLKFAHHGLQFFFITLCVEGRRKILSRIVDEKSRPIPTPLGECVVALWRHLHTLNPALTASNSVMEETERMMVATA